MISNILVIGGQGFLGSSIAKTLLKSGYKISIYDMASTNRFSNIPVNVHVGTLLDKDKLSKALDGIDTVLYFASHSIPSSQNSFLRFEIENSILSLELLLSLMIQQGVRNIIFPSSGGTVYGEIDQYAVEEMERKPLIPYGQGKFICEEIIKYYGRIKSLNYCIMRVANVYGCDFIRNVKQGIIDIYIQNIMMGLPITIWKNAENSIRDYLFIDDLCTAVKTIINKGAFNNTIYNIGTGVGSTVLQIINSIETNLNLKANIIFDGTKDSGLSKNILDVRKVESELGWTANYNLNQGIKETIKRKSKEKHL